MSGGTGETKTVVSSAPLRCRCARDLSPETPAQPCSDSGAGTARPLSRTARPLVCPGNVLLSLSSATLPCEGDRALDAETYALLQAQGRHQHRPSSLLGVCPLCCACPLWHWQGNPASHGAGRVGSSPFLFLAPSVP